MQAAVDAAPLYELTTIRQFQNKIKIRILPGDFLPLTPIRRKEKSLNAEIRASEW